MPENRRCLDWLVIVGTHHYARDRSYFKDYISVGQKVPHFTFGVELDIAGMGTVELLVHTGPDANSPTRTLVLENVLHIPAALCNGFCLFNYHRANGGSLGFRSGYQAGWDRNHSPLWCAPPFRGFERMVVAGDEEGACYFVDGLRPIDITIIVDESTLPRMPETVRPRAEDPSENRPGNVPEDTRRDFDCVMTVGFRLL
ncbi:uncharacterized protein KD926_002306 [Aspergillus affinis]|uniref:uncharacterized protein n=1 Tax=Aspergillus affinis TaxID=1070780 RepID=UPI0022FDC50E|nr:uncharacterized protein KD926_002306 [Aspergillus affinis]KAI9043927.1 hypothetical protein KD926_002306 [Aspergillus affinis]